MGRTKVLYEELLPSDFVARLNACPIAYLPLGTLEWHGYHLPLGSDGLQSRGFFELLAHNIGGIVLPMLYLGPDQIVSKDDKDYIGMECLSFETDKLQQLVGSAYYVEESLFTKILEITLWNLKRAGFQIVVAHGHGPSTNAFKKSIPAFEQQFGLKLFELWSLGGEGNEGIMMDHAAYNETSLMMGLYPELVAQHNLASEQDMVGIMGDDPRRATEQQGKAIIEKNLAIVGEKLVAQLAQIQWQPQHMSYTNTVKLYKD